MKYLLTLLLCVGIGGPVAACDADMPLVEVVAETAVDVAMASVQDVGGELSRLGNDAVFFVMALPQNLPLYEELGCSEADLERLSAIVNEVGENLNVAGKVFGQGHVTANYGAMLAETADGSISQQFKGAALICEGVGLMEQARPSLEKTATLMDEARAIIKPLVDPEETDPEA